jgi:Ca-activated chloride channel family protein
MALAPRAAGSAGMSALLADFHFLRPLALLLLALPLSGWLLWRRRRSDGGAWRAVVDAHLLDHLVERMPASSARAPMLLGTLAWTLAVLALAGPAWEREPMPLYRNQAARVIALELAPSMLAQDLKPSRLARARFRIDDILTRSRDFQTALVAYGADAFVAAPLTDDVGTVRNLVDALDPSTMPVAGNATGRAIERAMALIEQAGLRHGSVLLLADSVDEDAVGAARAARARGITVSVLGIGTAAGAPVPLGQGGFLQDPGGQVVVARLDEASLREVAAAGGGRYAPLSAGTADLDALLGDAPAAVDGVAAGDEGLAESARWRDRGPWLLLAVLPLVLAGFRRGWLLVLVLAAGFPAPPASAAALADLWRRPDQQAAAALADGDARRAAEVARSPDWRGSAAYRAGDYEAAAKAFADAGGADAHYNRGNALAKLGRYEDALGAYDEALQLAPGMEDAAANRKAVEEFLRQRQRQEGQQQSPQQQGKPDGDEQDRAQQQEPGQQPSGQQPSDQKPSRDPAQDGEDSDQQGQSRQGNDEAGKDAQHQPQDSEGTGKRQEGSPGSDETPAAAAPDDAQQQSLSKAIDKALERGEASGEPDAKAAAPVQDAAEREQRQALEHWLQRVPDDPGGLLRRKFQLEYQQRQQRGGDGG